MHPEKLARGRIDCDDIGARSDGRIDSPAGHKGRAFEIDFRPRPEGVGLEPPGDFELAEIVLRYLIERRVARASEIAAIALPLTGRRAVCGWCQTLRLRQRGHTRSKAERCNRCGGE